MTWLLGLGVGGLVLCVGIPLGWLWIGGQVEGATGSLALALLVAFAGAVASIVALVGLLGAANDRYGALRARRGLDDLGTLPLQIVLVCSAAGAGVAYLAWLVFVSDGTDLIPLSP